ncbi:Peroxiredoxin [Bacteroides faecichinchillae]|uniref:Peroxiredoxin n=2 Tax=Bacteroides faecichinchillae TaxID=871325 RepID=A0A1M5DK22_9BACE|nr:AhpC/TSA family protein [Bacteroides faecichinchillae]SHF67245.1 Peroxiredoxin [Bacteroides faecichinchillae]
MIIQRGSFGLLFFMSERLPGSTKYPIFVHHQKTMYMKRTFLLSFIVISACFCYAQQRVATYIVEGVLSDPSLEGTTVTIARYDNSKIVNSTKVSNGKFKITGEVQTPFLARIYAEKRFGILIVEEGTILIDMEKTHTDTGIPIIHPASGTPLNNEFANLKRSIDSLVYNQIEQYEQIEKEYTDSHKKAQLQNELIAKIRPILISNYQKVFQQHKNDVLGSYTIDALSNELSPDEMTSVFAQAGPYIMSLPNTQEIIKRLEKLKQTSKGKMFIDFEGKNENGQPLKLSNFVGKGKYTLIHFWSRSCGGCRKEMPIIAEVYKQFGNKGLEVIGVAVNEGSISTKKAIKELNVTWPQIFETGHQPFEIYGFNYIPQVMLFSPNGIILARDLNRENILSKVEEIFKP